MASPISFGPDGNRTGLALRFRLRRVTYKLFIGFAVRSQRTELTLPPYHPCCEPKKELEQPKLLVLAQHTAGDEEPSPEPPLPPPTGSTPADDGKKPGPPGVSISETKCWTVEIGGSREEDDSHGDS